MIATLLQVAGGGCVVAAAFTVGVGLGLLAAGAVLFGLGVLSERAG